MALYLVFTILALLISLPLLTLEWAVLLYALLVNLSFAHLGWHSATNINLPNAIKVVVLPTILFIRYYIQGKPRLKWSWFGASWLALVAYAGVACVWSPVRMAAVKELGYLCNFTLMFIVTLAVYRKDFHFFERALPILVLGPTLIGVWQTFYAGNIFGQFDGSMTSFTAKFSFGMWFAFCLVLLFTAAARADFCKEWVILLFPTVAIIEVLNSTRTAILAGMLVAAGAFLSSIVLKRPASGRIRTYATLWFLYTVLAISLLLMFPSIVPPGRYVTVASRYQEPLIVIQEKLFPENSKIGAVFPTLSKKEREAGIMKPGTINNLNFRAVRWRRATRDLGSRKLIRLLLGSGTSSCVRHARVSDLFSLHGDAAGIDANRVVHNAFLRVAIEWGVVGLVLFIMFFSSIVRRTVDLLRLDVKSVPGLLALGVIPLILFAFLGNPLASAGTPSGMGVIIWLGALFSASDSRRTHLHNPAAMGGSPS